MNTPPDRPSKIELEKEYVEFLAQPSESNGASNHEAKDEDFLAYTSQQIAPPLGPLALKLLPVTLLSGFLSLFLCPQFGLTPYKLEPDFLSHLLHQNLFICGLYCGGILYAVLSLSTYFYCSHYERLQLQKKLAFAPFFIAALAWAGFMLLTETDYTLSLKYNSGWLFAIVFGLTLSLYRRRVLLK